MPTARVSREDFLRRLEDVQPGLSVREIAEQSSCFAFVKGEVITFNEEVACRAPSGLPKDFHGAVQSKALLAVLRKVPDPKLKVEAGEGKIILSGKNKQAGVAMSKEVTLPVSAVDVPDKWRPLHEDFTDAVQIVQECASKDQSAFTLTCVHLHPDYMEAMDNTQLTRYKLKTGVKAPCLVRRDSLKHVPAGDFTEFAETHTFVHFRGNSGLVMSCRKYDDKFHDLSHLLTCKGTVTELPKALGKAAERCEIFSAENQDDNLVKVSIRKDRLVIRGEGDSGYYTEAKGISYSGLPMTFMMAPRLLVELVKRHSRCEISPEHRLKVDGGKFQYIACLELVEGKSDERKARAEGQEEEAAGGVDARSDRPEKEARKAPGAVRKAAAKAPRR